MVIAQTERLRLRRLELRDAAWIKRLVNEPSFIENIGDRNVKSIEDAERYLSEGPVASYAKFGFGLWAVERKSDGAPLGMCGLLKRDALEHADVGFAFFPEYWGQGYALEAAKESMRFGQTTLAMPEIWAITSPANQRSIRLLEKLGFRFAEQRSMFGPTVDTNLFKYRERE